MTWTARQLHRVSTTTQERTRTGDSSKTSSKKRRSCKARPFCSIGDGTHARSEANGFSMELSIRPCLPTVGFAACMLLALVVHNHCGVVHHLARRRSNALSAILSIKIPQAVASSIPAQTLGGHNVCANRCSLDSVRDFISSQVERALAATVVDMLHSKSATAQDRSIECVT